MVKFKLPVAAQCPQTCAPSSPKPSHIPCDPEPRLIQTTAPDSQDRWCDFCFSVMYSFCGIIPICLTLSPFSLTLWNTFQHPTCSQIRGDCSVSACRTCDEIRGLYVEERGETDPKPELTSLKGTVAELQHQEHSSFSYSCCWNIVLIFKLYYRKSEFSSFYSDIWLVGSSQTTLRS